MNYFIHNGEETKGPFSEEEIRSRLKAGELLSSIPICIEGDENWKPIAEVFEQLEYELPPPPEAHLKHPEEANKKTLKEVQPILGSARLGLARLFGEVRESGMTPALRLAAPVAAVGGFVSDVLQPVGPFSFYLFLGSLLVTIATGIWIWLRHLKSEAACCRTCARICSATAVSSVVLGITWLFFTSTSPNKGFLATRIALIEDLQESLLGVQQSVGRVETTVSKVSTDVSEIKTEVKGIFKGVNSIGKMGGLIKDPSTAMEHYNNALVYRKRGDVGSSRKSLEAFLNTGEEKIDPILMLIDALRSMEGPKGAKDAYMRLLKQHPENITLKTFLHYFLPSKEKILHLINIIRNNPDYTPAYYEYLGRGGQMGYLFSETGNGLGDITHKFTSDTYFEPYSIRSWGERVKHEKKYLNEEFKAQGINPAKLDDSGYRDSMADFSSKVTKARKRANLRLRILEKEMKVAHCESELEAIKTQILSYQNRIKVAFDSIRF
jgi:hypothetical protein